MKQMEINFTRTISMKTKGGEGGVQVAKSIIGGGEGCVIFFVIHDDH